MEDRRTQRRPETRGRRRRFSSRVLGWVYFTTVLPATLVLAATADLVPAVALAEWGPASLGSVAAVNAVACLLGVMSSLLGGLRSFAWRGGRLALLLAVNLVMLAVFPPLWLLGWLQSDDATFYAAVERPEFAMTIDDGLDPEVTPLLLDALADNDARATFFVLGETLAENRALVARLLAEGHELANHQWTDTPAVAMPPDAFEDEVGRANEALVGISEPRWFRPGGGILPETGPDVARRLGLQTALGSVFPFDSHIGYQPFLTAYVEGRTRAGSIVVLHDRGDRGHRAAAVLRQALPALRARGLRAVTLTELTRE